jgi:hypothetical protein
MQRNIIGSSIKVSKNKHSSRMSGFLGESQIVINKDSEIMEQNYEKNLHKQMAMEKKEKNTY